MHKQDKTTTDPGLQSIVESMYTAASLEPLSEKHATAKCDHPGCKDGKHPSGADCKKCGGDGWIDANDLKTGPKKKIEEAPGNSLDAWNAKMNKDDEIGRIPHDVDPFKDPFKGSDDQDNTSYQVAAELDAAADGDFIKFLNTIEFDERGAAELVEWLTRYNLGAS